MLHFRHSTSLHLIRLLSAVIVISMVACVRGPRRITTQARTPYVSVERQQEGRWSATWHFDSPVAALRFERPAGGFRARTFEIITPGYAFTRDGDFEVLKATGTPSRDIKVVFPEYDAELIREYEFFRRFTDGSSAMYTGHLLAAVVDAGADSSAIAQFLFTPPAGASVLVDGQRHSRAVNWEDRHGRGTYVYFGAIEPVESADVISIVDPGLPDWIERRTREVLPELFAMYRKRLDAAPKTRPLVMFDYRPTGSGYSNGGGTLPGQIQLGVQGAGWQREAAGPAEQLIHFLAHESAHIWNGEIVHSDGVADAWMHEGSADAFADRALLALRLIDSAGYLERQTTALNDCVRGLATTPLRNSVQRGQPRLAYTCGNMIALLTEQSLREKSHDLFDFWRALIARSASRDSRYDVTDYQATWRQLGGSDSALLALQEILDGKMTPAKLVATLRSHGVQITQPEPPRSYGQAVAREAFALLMASDCNGRIGYRVSSAGLVLDSNVQCGALLPGGSVTAIAGYDILANGHLAYDAASERCTASQPIAISMLDASGVAREVSVRCNRPIPGRQPYFRVER